MSVNIYLDIDVEQSLFRITGETFSILRNRPLRFFLFNSLKAIDENSIIAVPFTPDTRENVLTSIKEALIEHELEVTESERVFGVLKNYYDSLSAFEEFSQKAKGIWNNLVDRLDFEKFTTVLRSSFPNRRLYPLQLLASYHLCFSQNACNFSVPGAGKTSIVYGAYAYLRSLAVTDKRRVNKILIVGPLSSFAPWENEFQECFGYRAASFRLAGGTQKFERQRYLLSVQKPSLTPELTLMTYPTVANNLSEVKAYLQKEGNDVMVVLDEAHKIKNVDGGIWAQSVLEIASLCKSRVVLTGTPTPNGYQDLFNLYNFIWPGKDIIKFNVHHLREMSENRFDYRIEELIDNISPFFIRIRKHDILPEQIFPLVNNPPEVVKMTAEQREIYDAIESKYIPAFMAENQEFGVASSLAKARLVRLMQAATNLELLQKPLERFLIDDGAIDDLLVDDKALLEAILKFDASQIVPPKFKACKEIIQNLITRGERVIVWATFLGNIHSLSKYLAHLEIPNKVLVGDVPVERDDISMEEIETREKIIAEFHKEKPSFSVIIANPFAVAESISLHKVCHHAIYLERTFNAGAFIQSKDRIHRVGLNPG
ncbi:MAG: ATP-dependent helicase, partial [Sphingobacteriales bacterium]